MKKRVFAIAIAVIGLFLAAAYLRMDSSTPSGQEPLLSLTDSNFAAFETAFDKSTAGPCLLLLSPS